MLFGSQLRRKEQNWDLELENGQLSFSLLKAEVSWNNWKTSRTTSRGPLGRRQVVCACAFTHACVSVCVLHLTTLRTQGSSTVFCSTLWAFVQRALSHPWCNRLLAFVLESFHLPWNHKPQLLDFHTVLQLQCYFMGCVSMGGTSYLWHKAQM